MDRALACFSNSELDLTKVAAKSLLRNHREVSMDESILKFDVWKLQLWERNLEIDPVAEP
jgi:hypothetical protein